MKTLSLLMAACVAAALALPGSAAWASDKRKPVLVIRVDDIPPGTMKTFRWKGRPFVVVRTTDAMLDDLRDQTGNTWSERPIPADRPAFFVFSKVGPAPGCTLVHAPKGSPRYAPNRLWQGGFYDPCRFGEWDYAGRTIRQYEDQQETMRRADLEVPAYELTGPSTLRLVR